jgi:glutamate carboxypeptidase
VIQQVAAKTSFGLVFEGGREGDRIITARKGTGTFTLTAHGKEAHAGNQHAEGLNAIHAMALLIPQVESLTDYDQGTTVNVGIMEGGTAKNTVPGKAECTIDARVSTVEQARHVESSLQRIVDWSFAGAEEIPARLRQTQVVLGGAILRLPMESTPSSQELRTRYETFAEQQGLGIGEAPPQGGGSDANLFAASGVPTIDGLGPYGKYFHSIQEWSSLRSLKQRTKALACFLVSECS